MSSSVVRGVILCLMGALYLWERFFLDARWPWPVGYAFVAFGIIELWRGAQYRRNRSPTDKMLDEADAVRKRDPIEADRLEDEAFRIRGEEEKLAIERLRAEARHDVRVARELEEKLHRILKLRAAARMDFEANRADDPRLPAVLRNMDEANAETQKLLEEARDNMRRLRP